MVREPQDRPLLLLQEELREEEALTETAASEVTGAVLHGRVGAHPLVQALPRKAPLVTGREPPPCPAKWGMRLARRVWGVRGGESLWEAVQEGEGAGMRCRSPHPWLAARSLLAPLLRPCAPP